MLKKQRLGPLLALLLALVLTLSATVSAQEEALSITYIRQESGDSFIELPQVQGHPDQAIEAILNAAIMSDSDYVNYVSLLAGLDPLGTGLQQSAQVQIIPGKNSPGVLSILIDAQGRIGPGRPGHRFTPLMYDLSNAQRIEANDLFSDIEVAQGALDRLLEQLIEPAISDYLYPEGLYPLPIEQVLLDESGLSFYYTQEAYTTLSGQSGAVHFHWDELEGIVNQEAEALLASLQLSSSNDDAMGLVLAAASQGRFPGLPVIIGEPLEEVLQEYPLLIDSEVFPSGELYQLEDARYRGTVLIADEYTVTGLLSRRMNLWGIIAGKSTNAQVQNILGQPDASLALDEATAAGYGFEVGMLDSYTYGDYQIRFHYDSDQTLRTIWLSRLN